MIDPVMTREAVNIPEVVGPVVFSSANETKNKKRNKQNKDITVTEKVDQLENLTTAQCSAIKCQHT